MCGKQVIGSVAVERPQAGAGLQGVVLHKNFQLTIVSVDEIAQHAGLQVAQVTSLSTPYLIRCCPALV